MSYSNGQIAIAICDRCHLKYPYQELRADGFTPGLRVCSGCWDTQDPWSLPAPPPDQITLRFPRPDSDIAVTEVSPDLSLDQLI